MALFFTAILTLPFFPRQHRELDSLSTFIREFFDHMLSSLVVHFFLTCSYFWDYVFLVYHCLVQFLSHTGAQYIFTKGGNKTKFKTTKTQPYLDFIARYLIFLVMGLYRDTITVQAPQPPLPQPYLVPVSRTGKSIVKDNVFSIILFLEQLWP